MTYAEALDSLASHPHAHRFRELVADDYHDQAVRDAWRDQLILMASEPLDAVAALPNPPVSESIRATQLGFRNCWLSTVDSSCGCSGVQCHLLHRIVTLHDCVSCLKRW